MTSNSICYNHIIPEPLFSNVLLQSRLKQQHKRLHSAYQRPIGIQVNHVSATEPSIASIDYSKFSRVKFGLKRTRPLSGLPLRSQISENRLISSAARLKCVAVDFTEVIDHKESADRLTRRLLSSKPP